MITTLEKFGLSEKQAKVYLASLELGPSPVQRIAKKAGVNRATTYVNLESLMKMGLISTFEKGKKTFFSAESPKHLELLLKKEEDSLLEKKSEFTKNLPELEALFNLSGDKPVVRFFEGKSALDRVQQELDSVTKPGDKTYSVVNLDNVYSTFPDYRENQAKHRIDRKRKLFQIYTSKNGAIRKTVDNQMLRESHYIPQDKFPVEVSVNIIPNYGLRIANYKGGYSAVIIKDDKIAKTFETIFKLAWEASSKYNKDVKKKA